MKKPLLLFLILFLIVIVVGCTSTEKIVAQAIVYKSSTCGCCGNYASYLDNQGLEVETVNVGNMIGIKDKYGVPAAMESCHTTVIDNYFIEGHVPIEAVKKLLEERPDIKGIALPGMPSASPGMPGSKLGEFKIYSILSDGSTELFINL